MSHTAAHTLAEPALVALLERHRSGDPAALNALMGEIYPSVHRIVYRLAGPKPREIHEDLVQSVLEQMCRAIDTFEGRSRFTTFVFSICHRVIARERRYHRVRSWFKKDAEEVIRPQARALPDELVDYDQQVQRGRAALDGLDREERAAFVLFEMEELPLEEVSNALGCSTRTVKRRLRTAREKLLIVHSEEAS